MEFMHQLTSCFIGRCLLIQRICLTRQSSHQLHSRLPKGNFFFWKRHNKNKPQHTNTNHSHLKMAELEASLYGMNHNMTHEMPMYFVNSIMLHNFMFKGLMVHKWWQYMLTLIIIFILAVFNQFMYSIIRRKIPTLPKGDYVSLDDSTRMQKFSTYAWYFVKPTLFLFQNTLSYMLMLMVMSFNMGVFLSVVLGTTVGWTIFSMRSNIPPPEECH